MKEIVIGDIFKTNEGGSVTVIEVIMPSKLVVEFNCPYGHKRVIARCHLVVGAMKNPYKPSNYGVGFIGSGKYKLQDSKGVATRCTNMWRNMLKRCYNQSSLSANPSYIGCTVHPDWHNYQVFSEWYYTQEFKGKGYQLDKDILVRGNKVYSPDTCAIIPEDINLLLFKKENNRGLYMLGVEHRVDGRDLCYMSRMTKNNKACHLGSFATELEAHQAYVIAKEAYVKEVAEKYKNSMDRKVYHALMNWRVNCESI